MQRLLQRLSRGDRWIPWLFVAGMAVVVVVNGGLVYFALHSYPGLVADHAYERGLAYNRVLAAEARQEAMGWQVAATLTRPQSQPGQGELLLTVTDQASHPIADLAVTGSLFRPLEASAPIPIVLSYIGSGRYRTVVPLPAPGQWELKASLQGAAGDYQLSRRLIAP